MIRPGLISLVVGLSSGTGAWLTEKGALQTTLGFLAVTGIACGLFMLGHRLLERIAPAEPEGRHTYFNPKAPGQPLPKDSIVYRGTHPKSEHGRGKQPPTNPASV